MLTQKRLKDILLYDPETGLWIWINPPNHNTRLKGKEAGNVRPDGYRRIRIDGTGYYASHLACLYMTGEWPKEEMDHWDRDPSNDRWENLREATSSQNKFNSVHQSGLRGVYPKGNKWQVMAGSFYLGLFDKIEEAIAVRDAAVLQMAGPFAILNNQTEGVMA